MKNANMEGYHAVAAVWGIASSAIYALEIAGDKELAQKLSNDALAALGQMRDSGAFGDDMGETIVALGNYIRKIARYAAK
jgi:hypothetical protein